MKEKAFAPNPALRSRTEFNRGSLAEDSCSQDPFLQFEKWLSEALEKDPACGNAMSLSTVSTDGTPDSRIVLLRNVSYGGLTFFTNYRSAKGRQIAAHPKACALFFWKELERQLKVQGEIRFLPQKESDDYFNDRPFESQVGAWASAQSEIVESRQALDAAYDKQVREFRNKTVPRPGHWGGYVLLPLCFEFWQGRANRLHDRIRYTLGKNGEWLIERLMP